MNVIFMGTPDFAVPCLKELVNSGNNVIQVITQPDRPKGRGRKLTPPPVKAAAQEMGIPVFQPEKIKTLEATEYLKELNPDLIVVVAFGQILSKEILDIPKFGCINVHASVLPQYRGPAPIHWAVMNGDQVTGVSIMYMDEGMDTGDVMLIKKVSISKEDTTGILHDKLADLGARALEEALELVDKDEAPRFSQEHSKASYAPMLDREVEHIDWVKPAIEIYNQVRGLNPWPGAHTYMNGKVLKIWAVEVANEKVAQNMLAQTDGSVKYGKIIDVLPKQGIAVAVGDGVIWIKELQLQGSKKMEAVQFINGRSVEPGQVLGE